MKNIEHTNKFIKEEREVLLQHKLYAQIDSVSKLRKFTEVHVYAVWDFMSLLKALQIKLTCTTIPWFASSLPMTRYLINEIVLAEESDDYIDGRKLSHFEMYLDAMKTLGADTANINKLIYDLKSNNNIIETIENQNIDGRIIEFLKFTFEVIASNKPHLIASAFTFGREDLIPDMFTSILTELQHRFPESDLTKLNYYFQRHIELDGDEHGPLAMQMIEELAGEDQHKWDEIKETARQALVKR